MESNLQGRSRAASHAEYIEALPIPSQEEIHRIRQIQLRHECEIDEKYRARDEDQAATTIQKAYRGHRARRELSGSTLNPSARWLELIREWRYQSAAAPQYGPGSARVGADGRPRATSDVAKLSWKRIAAIAEHAGAGDMQPREEVEDPSAADGKDLSMSSTEPFSMLMDVRYFLEMVDQKHRYGANLMVYHGEWLRSNTNENFFRWLDHGAGRHMNLQGCNRAKLDRERIRYLSRDERKDYLVRVDIRGRLRWHKNGKLITTSVDQFKDSMSGIVPIYNADAPAFQDQSVVEQLAESRQLVRQMARASTGSEASPADSDSDSSSDAHDEDSITRREHRRVRKAKEKLHVSPATILNHLLRASVKPGTWIYVADTVGRLYVGIKASGSFQHASFLSGARISSAGSIGIEAGRLVYLSPLSGHYRPTTKSFRIFLDSLDHQGVDMSQLRISKAFEALHALEIYTRKKKVVHHAVHGRDRSTSGADKDRKGRTSNKERHSSASPRRDAILRSVPGDVDSDRSRVGEHRLSLTRLASHLHIRSKSEEARLESRVV